MASIKNQNLESKVLIAKGEEWVDEDESSDKEVKKDECLIAYTDESFSDEASNNSSAFEVDLSKASSVSKVHNWDSSSLYQVKTFVTYTNNENITMFEHLHLDLSKSNREICILRDKM